ncbi:heme utilization protein [Pseudomonas poae]|uniref:Heme utilization protein n=1 Tax=Pseudomonas poae TaxID=200451 RepID=A0A2S9ET36_9PSED|nr:heme utilization protein [Pseudomonas poae]PRA32997.1 heme utilization protein [Pseudomonas poae]PRC18892.1 heme utilization protein [Pseudomonas poae]
MKTTMALKPLAFALAALMAVAAQAGDYKHPKPQPAPTSSAATVNDGQSNHGNVVINDKTENNASVNESFKNYSGVAGSNTAAGDNNQGKNDVAITAGDADFVFATVNSGQDNRGNFVLNSATENNGSVNDSFNNGSGIGQSNVSAGTSNQGSNSVAINSGDGKGGASTINAAQEVTGNLTLNLSATGHGWKTTPVTNNASVNNSFNTATGIVGSNVAAGSGNQGQNNVAITRF